MTEERRDAARKIKDVPEPRRNESIIGPLFQAVFKWPYRMVLLGLYRAGVRAWHLTSASLLMNLVVGILLLRGDRFLPGILLLPAGILDVLDGGVARMRGEQSPFGAFLDSTLDRVSDAIVFGCLFWSLSGQGRETEAVLAIATLAISLAVSQIRAEGEALGVTLSEGIVQRLERYVAMMVGLTAPGALLPVLVILTGLGGITILQRGWSAWRGLARKRPEAPGD
jgi:CDP-diacylglycerol--glycerol-3-phosphate 3-phosphatidyltransferase